MKKLAFLASALLIACSMAYANKSVPNESTEPVIGRIAFLSDSKITIKIKGQPEITAFTINNSTKVEINGEASVPGALKFDWKVEVTPAPGEPSIAEKIVKLSPTP